jgi:hypothetical protein
VTEFIAGMSFFLRNARNYFLEIHRMNRLPSLKTGFLSLLLATGTSLAADTTRPKINITAPASGATVSGTITLAANASDNIGVAGVQFYVNGAPLGAEDLAAPYTVTAYTASVPDGTYTLTAVARDAAGNLRTSAPVTVSVINNTTPYTGTPYPVPGIIQAENFDRGGEGIAYHDKVQGNSGGRYRTAEDVDIIVSSDPAGGGHVINSFETGEWLNYTIDVQSTASYDIELRASSPFAGGAFRIELDGQNLTGQIAMPNTGSWSNFQWIGRKSVPLAAGRHVMRIVADQQFFNLNSIRLQLAADSQAPSAPANLGAAAASSSQIDLSWSPATDAVGVAGYRIYRNGTQIASLQGTAYSNAGLSPATNYSYSVEAFDAAGNVSARSNTASATTRSLQAPYSGSPIPLPGIFQAEDFDLGGEGIAYHENVAGNAGGQYRSGEDVDIFASFNAQSGGYVVNNFETGEWLAYSVNVQAAGSYDIEILASSFYSAGSAFHVEIDGVDVTGRVTVPLTSSWADYRWSGRKNVPLAAGNHVLRIVSDQEHISLDAVRVVASAPVADPGSVLFSCSFPNSPLDCGFFEQAKVPGRASVLALGRDGLTAVRLHTEPGDNNVAGSGSNERDDLQLSQAASDCYEGREAWWAHSMLFPDDYVDPPMSTDTSWNWGVVFDFHNSAPGAGQANFQITAWPATALYSDRPTGLEFQVAYGDQGAPTVSRAPIGPVVRNIWYDFVYHVRWSSGSDGYIDAWVNGVQKLAHRGPTIYAGQGCYLKLANYHTPHGQPSSIVHDRVIRGSTPAAVALGALQGVLP